MTGGKGAFLAVDLGGSLLRVACGGPAGTVGTRHTQPVGASPTPEGVAAAVAAAAGRLHPDRVAAAGVSCPGVIDADAGVVLAARNLVWRDVPLAQLISERLDCPVRVENDANLAALGEAASGAGRGRTSVAFIGVGTGVGAGLVIDGRVLRGAGWAAGEVGRLPAGVAGAAGDTLGVEEVASGPAIRRRALELGLDLASTEEVFAAVAAGDPRARAVVADAARALALAIAAIAAVVDPELFIVGGGVSAQGEALLQPVRAEATRMGVRSPVVQSVLGADSQLYGALQAAISLAPA